MAVAGSGVEVRRGRQECRGAAPGVSTLQSAAGEVERVLALAALPGGPRLRFGFGVRAAQPAESSHALLPDFLFHRRLDEVAIIGQVLALTAVHNAAVRALARRFDLPRATVRAWWGRFRTRSPTVLTELLDVAIRLNPAPVDLLTDGEAAVFEALDQAVIRARVRFGERVGDAWRFWSRISGGRVLATNTSASWRYRSGRSWMAASR